MFILKVFRSGLNTLALNQNLYSFGILVPRLFIFSWRDTVIQISLSSSLGVKCYYECLRRARVNGIGFLRSSKVVDECQVSILQKIYLMKMPPYTHKCSCKKCGILGKITLYKIALRNVNSYSPKSSQNNSNNSIDSHVDYTFSLAILAMMFSPCTKTIEWQTQKRETDHEVGPSIQKWTF